MLSGEEVEGYAVEGLSGRNFNGEHGSKVRKGSLAWELPQGASGTSLQKNTLLLGTEVAGQLIISYVHFSNLQNFCITYQIALENKVNRNHRETKE